MRCLIVEDCEDLAELWRLELEERGFAAQCAHSAEEAFKRLLLDGVELIVTDLGLPDGSGLTVAQGAAIRAPEAEVVVVTAQFDFPHGELFDMSRNIAGVFRKTQDMNDMFAFVEHLRARRARSAPELVEPTSEASEAGRAAV